MGVKNGINAFGKKNYLGTFSPPFAVINDAGFLSTLSDRDWRGGTTEAVKVALIRDPQFFEFLEQHAAALVDRDLGDDGEGDPAVGGPASATHRDRRRSVRAGLVASAGLRSLGGAQARTGDQPPARARRGGRHRDRARQHLLVSGGFSAGSRLAANHSAAWRARRARVRSRDRGAACRRPSIPTACSAGWRSSRNTWAAG